MICRYGPAVNLFEKLVLKDGEVASLLAQSYVGLSEFLLLTPIPSILSAVSGRRGGQGRSNPSSRLTRTSAILCFTTRTSRFPALQSKFLAFNVIPIHVLICLCLAPL